MLFSGHLQKTLAVGATLLGAASAGKEVPFQSTQECESLGEFASQSLQFGESPGGSEFCLNQLSNGALIRRIETWSDNQIKGQGERHSIVGLKVTYDNDDWTIIGDIRDQFPGRDYMRTKEDLKWDPANQAIEWAFGEDLKDDSNTWLNTLKIKIKGADEKVFLCGGWGTDRDRCPQNPPKDNREFIWGTLLGISGKYGDGGVEQIKLWSLHQDDEVKDSTISDIEFNPPLAELNKKSMDEKNITQQTLMVGHCVNKLDTNTTYAVNNKYTYRKTQQVAVTSADTFHLGAHFTWKSEFGMEPAKASVEAGIDFFWEHKMENTETTGEEHWDERSYGPSSVIVGPNSAVKVTAYVVQGYLDLAWKAKKTINLRNGKTFTIPVQGTTEFTRYSDAWHFVDKEDMKTAEEAISGGQLQISENAESKTRNLEDDPLQDTKPKQKARRFIA